MGWPFEKSCLAGDAMRRAGVGWDLGCQRRMAACGCRPTHPGEEQSWGCLHLGIPVVGL